MTLEQQSNGAQAPGRSEGILLVVAHPDDETFLSGATLAYYARRGVPTALLCFTDGQAGRMGLHGVAALANRETLGAIRREELQRAAAVLGIGELITPGWMDGELNRIPDEQGVAEVFRAIHRLRPRVVISFGTEGAPNRHPDHIATARWTEMAVRKVVADESLSAAANAYRIEKYYWSTWPRTTDHLRGTAGAPITTTIELGAEYSELKRRTFAEHRTQQDHLKVFGELVDAMDHKEYFHLRWARDPSTAVRHDLF